MRTVRHSNLGGATTWCILGTCCCACGSAVSRARVPALWAYVITDSPDFINCCANLCISPHPYCQGIGKQLCGVYVAAPKGVQLDYSITMYHISLQVGTLVLIHSCTVSCLFMVL